MDATHTLFDSLDDETRAALEAAVADMAGTDLDPALEGEPEPEAAAPVVPLPAPAPEPEPEPAAATVTTERLTLNRKAREKLVGLFTDGRDLKTRRVKGLLQYRGYSAEQIVAAMHRSADDEGVPLVIPSGAVSTIKRSLTVAKAWYATEANALVGPDDDSRDAVFGYLADIADYPGTALEAYEVAEADRQDAKVKEWNTVIVEALVPEGKPGYFAPYEFDVDHGAGLAAIPGIVAEYVTHRLKDESGDIALDWLRRYRDAVRFASNERRRKGQEHDTLAADARVGGQGNVRGAKNPGGKASGPSVTEAERQAAGTPDHRQPGDKPLREASLSEIIAGFHKRVIDYGTPITLAEVAQINALMKALDEREAHVPWGQAIAKPAPVADPTPLQGTPVPAPAPAPAVHSQVGPAPVNPDAARRAVLAELAARGITVEMLQAAAQARALVAA